MYNAANANQKEKYEADLKKEIKKLQVSLFSGYAPYLVDGNKEYVNKRVVLAALASARSNKDVANVEWYQGQKSTDGKQKIDWNSE